MKWHVRLCWTVNMKWVQFYWSLLYIRSWCKQYHVFQHPLFFNILKIGKIQNFLWLKTHMWNNIVALIIATSAGVYFFFLCNSSAGWSVNVHKHLDRLEASQDQNADCCYIWVCRKVGDMLTPDIYRLLVFILWFASTHLQSYFIEIQMNTDKFWIQFLAYILFTKLLELTIIFLLLNPKFFT